MADATLVDIDEDKLRLQSEGLKTSDGFLFFLPKPKRRNRFALLHFRGDSFEQAYFLLVRFPFFRGFRFLELVLEFANTVRDNLKVGEEYFLPKQSKFLGEIAASESVQNDQKSTALAQDCQAARVVTPLGRQQAWRIEELDGGRRGLLGMKQIRKPSQSLVRNFGDADLPSNAGRWVRFHPGQPPKHGAFARPCETGNAHFHEIILPGYERPKG